MSTINNFFNNILRTVTQNSGINSFTGLSEGERAFIKSVKSDLAVHTRNWNVILYPILSTLRSQPNHEYDVLDSTYGGLSGWTITTEPWATKDSMECLWDSTRGQPHSITGTIMCLATQLSQLSRTDVTVNEYDDSELRSTIDCIDLNMNQVKNDVFGECYTYNCDGEPSLQYPVLRHLYEIFRQVISGGPTFELSDCYDSDYPTISVELRSSEFIYDELLPLESISYCGTNLEEGMTVLRTYIGQTDCAELEPNYSTKTPSAASVGNQMIADTDDLATAIKAIDQTVNSWSIFDIAASTGSVSGTISNDSAAINQTFTFIAGNQISLTGGTAGIQIALEPMDLDDLSDVDTSGAATGDYLMWNGVSGDWEPKTPLDPGNVSIFIRPGELDQRGRELAGGAFYAEISTSSDLTPTSPSSAHTESLHYNNLILRKTYEQTGGSIPFEQWYAHNVAVFNFVGSLLTEDQMSYFTFPVPRIWNGSSFRSATVVKATLYAFCQAEAPSELNGTWAAHTSSDYTFALSFPTDPSAGAGTVTPLIDGRQMTTIEFHQAGQPVGWVEGTSTNVNKDYQISVIEFNEVDILNTSRGIMTVCLTPASGTGFFDRQDPAQVYFLGLQLDFR